MGLAPIPCFGICRGVTGWKDPKTGLCCTVCQGSGLYKVPPSAAEEYAAVRRSRDARLYPKPSLLSGAMPRVYLEPDRRSRKRRAPRATSRVVAASEVARAERRRQEQEIRDWKKSHAPTVEQLDELKKEYRTWTKRPER